MSREVGSCFLKGKRLLQYKWPEVHLQLLKCHYLIFVELTKIPIIIYYGDFIPEEPMDNPGQDGWRARLEMARLWMNAVNSNGGDVTVVHLPEIGIKGSAPLAVSI